MKFLREKWANLTLDEAAEGMPVRGGAINTYETGRANPKLATITALFERYGMRDFSDLQRAYDAMTNGGTAPVRPHMSPDEELGRMLRRIEDWQRFGLGSMGARLDEYEKELKSAAEREAARDAEIARLQEIVKRKQGQ